ncbi:MAG: LD-carboxypeptidase [Alphaproteobacteria bacterium]|nr:LD-carboxypeptidase [Alphaproteobacteria bacterium]
MFPEKLKAGDEVRIVAPSLSYKIIGQDIRGLAKERLEKWELVVSFGKNVESCNQFASSSISERAQDLHDAFSDKNVKAVFAVIGGFNSNELLPYLDYDLIKNNPKFLVGYSDITALLNAIYTKTGLVTYCGPAFSTLGMKKGAEYCLDYLHEILFSAATIDYRPSSQWSDDLWYLDQENRNFHDTKGPVVINEGTAQGRLIGGEMTTLQLLLGTPYMPSLADTILALEVTDIPPDNALKLVTRVLESLTQQARFDGVRGIILGRFERMLKIDTQQFVDMVKSHERLKGMPVVCDMDFGHTFPMITLPVGGRVGLNAAYEELGFRIYQD